MASPPTYHASSYSDTFEFIQERNVVVIGKAKAGKSVLINKIIGEQIMKSSNKVHDKTEVASGTIRCQGKRYSTMFIETVGIRDPQKPNELEKIKSAMEDEKLIHLVIFVFKKDDCFNNDTQHWSKLFLDHFTSSLFDISAVVITHCGNDLAEEIEETKSQLQRNESTKDFFQMIMSERMYFVGFPEANDAETSNINKMRLLIANSTQPSEAKELKENRTKSFCCIS